ncbi:MAG: hypothetical protein JNM94_18740 [Phycisphaerae bacterium]|nr:hypothetical protein [Phycisphaerae bacterium]
MSQSRKATIGWLVVFIFGAVGLAWNAFSQPRGFGMRYVTDSTTTYYEVKVSPPIGSIPKKPKDGEGAVAPKDRLVWVSSDSPDLEKSNVTRTSAEPISVTRTSSVPPIAAWAAAENGGKGPTGATYRFSVADTIGVWIAAFFTLAIFSFLWGDNPVYKFAESVVIGVSAAYWMVVAFWSTLVPKLAVPIAPIAMQWAVPGVDEERKVSVVLAVIPAILGVMLLFRLSSKLGWVSSWPLAFVVGTTAAIRLIAHVQADFLAQISNSMVPFVVSTNGRFDWGASLGNVVLVTGLLSVIVYFFFSLEHKGAVGKVARFGVWFLMIAFGAAFAFTVMGRITLLSERLEFLFNDWLWLIDPKGDHTVTTIVSNAAGLLATVF